MNNFINIFLLVVMSVMFVASAGGVEWGSEECGNYAALAVGAGAFFGIFISLIVSVERRIKRNAHK